MAAIVSNNFRSLNAKGFIQDIRSELSNVYIGVGKPTAWQDSDPSLSDFTDSAAPAPSDTIDNLNQARANMVGIKLLNDNDVSHVAPRYDWAAGQVYDTWDSNDANIFEKRFYVLTNDFKVYKCLDRPTDTSQTSDVPTKVQAAPFNTADGYTWKYMYTIVAADSEKFLTRSYMPVKTLTISTTGVVATGTTIPDDATTLTLTDENPDIMVGQSITHSGSGLLTGTSTPYVTAVSGKVVTFSPAHDTSGSGSAVAAGQSITFGDFEDTNPLYDQQQAQKDSVPLAGGIDRIEIVGNGGTGYSGNNAATIATNLHVIGDGSGATILTADVTKSVNGVSRLTTTAAGTGYSVAKIEVKAGLAGTGLEARAVIAPVSGHGVDPVAELGGFYVGLNSQISGVDDIDIANNQDFRQITILKNPTVSGAVQTETAAKAAGSNRGTYRTTKYVTFTTGSDDAALTMSNLLTNGKDVLIKGNAVNGTTGALAQAYVVNVDLTSGVRRIYYVQNDLTGYQAFDDGAAIVYSNDAAPTGSTSGITLGAENTWGGTAFDKTSGEILFVENRDPIQRSNTQIEDIKLIIEF
jgi:hypothetical protein